MSFIIVGVEIIPYQCKEYEHIGFKPIPAHTICSIVPAIVVNTLKKMNGIEVEFQGYVYKYTEDKTIVYAKISNPGEDSYEYYEGQKYVKKIKDLIGKELDIKDIPFVKFSDLDTHLPAYIIEKDIIKLYSRVRNGRMFGNTTYKTQLLANIYITGSNGRKIIDYCDRCGFRHE